MEQFNTIFGALAGAVIVPIIYVLKKVLEKYIVEFPFIYALISNGLALAFGFILNSLFKWGLPADQVIVGSLAIIGTAAQLVHAGTKTIDKNFISKDGGVS
jgi:hypothetical protein